ncbi:MAG: tRNA uridine-5-carboxymethylaminomethyl(34) synthesis GTPase MnmE, partial [Nitrospinota bacterium]
QEVVKRIFRTPGGKRIKNLVSHRVRYGFVVDPSTGTKLDEVLLTFMQGPRSYTAEDVCEISCHGGIMTLRRVLEVTLAAGARLAEPGEFTKRAFLNGRLDLTQAEAVLDLIQATSDLSMRNALRQLEGGLSQEVQHLRQQLIEVLAALEAAIDFPEEDIEIIENADLLSRLTRVLERLHPLIESFRQGRLLREGVLLVLIGKPNVGKSSLFNALLSANRAIVTPVPGTTRDVIEERLSIRGYPFRLCDTAGIRPTRDTVEQEGVVRSRQLLETADLLLFLLDASLPWEAEDEALLEEVQGRHLLFVVNKIDLPRRLDTRHLRNRFPQRELVEVSATTGLGLPRLEEAICRHLFQEPMRPKDEGVLVTRLRHQEALLRCREHVEEAIASLQAKMSGEFVALDIQAALESLGEIVGESFTEDLLDQIFRDFCIGK